jgi:hypothetical protein
MISYGNGHELYIPIASHLQVLKKFCEYQYRQFAEDRKGCAFQNVPK